MVIYEPCEFPLLLLLACALGVCVYLCVLAGVCVYIYIAFWLTNTCILVGLAGLGCCARILGCVTIFPLLFFYVFCLFLLECQLQTFKVSWRRQLRRAKQGQEAGARGPGDKTNDKVCKCMCMFPLCKCVSVWCLCGLSCLFVA